MATVAASRTSALLADGQPATSALTGGYHLAFGVAAAVVVGAVILAATVLRSPAAPAQPSDGPRTRPKRSKPAPAGKPDGFQELARD